jgi:serine/threonine-protein kinase RsbW
MKTVIDHTQTAFRAGRIEISMSASVPQNPPEQLRLPAELSSASPARAFVRQRAQQAGFDPITVQDIEVAVGEAVSNAILYGSKKGMEAGREKPSEFVVIVERTATHFVVSVQDSGPGFDQPMVDTSTLDNLLAERGRGLALMQMLMDKFEMFRVPGGMVVRMERRLPAASGRMPSPAPGSMHAAASPNAIPAPGDDENDMPAPVEAPSPNDMP